MIVSEVRPGRWADSAKLMAAARAAEGEAGVARAACFMGTPANLEQARELGLLSDEVAAAGPDDLVIAVAGDDPEGGLAAARRTLDQGAAGVPAAGRGAPAAPRSLGGVDADLALISVPGDYAALEAHKALGAGMDVMLFSDNVSEHDEVVLKRRAHALGLLVMGPGCGTAIVDGTGLAFANVVARGPVGVVAAAGTGAQEVTVLLDRFSSGVSRCYGTGGRDLHEEVGAITALDAIDRLARDPETRVILCVSKPPAPDVARRVLDALAASGKPAAACLLGADAVDAPAGVEVRATLDDAALAAARLAGADPEIPEPERVDWVIPGFVRGLFSGGTLCSEAAAILADRLGQVWSNAPAGRAGRLAPGEPPRGHACLDLGEEEYTRGRPHPMIDPQARVERLAVEAADHDVAVLLLDVVLGYASHPDPAGALAGPVRQAMADRPNLAVVAHVCGTEADPQVRSRQEATLAAAGVRLAPTSAGAARLAAALVR
ncbi:MAG: acyl-CoA synthetase FdrA [Thermoleophilia bacterium]|jgi:FdrA protein|nr:acyl-CoA synthetase FdrA [Thermoleophilia bacterium]